MATSDFIRILSGQEVRHGISISKILERGGKLVYQDKDGNYENGESPLIVAIKWKAPINILEVITHNYPQDLNKPSSYGMTPLAIARQYKLVDIIKYLEEKGAEDNTMAPLSGTSNDEEKLFYTDDSVTGGRRKRKTKAKKSKKRRTNKKSKSRS